MKKIWFLVLVLLVMVQFAWCYELKEVNELNNQKIRSIIGKKFVSYNYVKVAKKNGNLFILARDENSRRLEWFVIDPFAGKLVKKGVCPFQVITLFGVSPENRYALVVSRMPTNMWLLNIEAGEWRAIYQNPEENQPGLAMISNTPVTFVDEDSAYVLMDEWDKDHFTTDVAVVSIKVDPPMLDKIISMKDLFADSKEKMAGCDFEKMELFPGPIRFGPSGSFVYTIQTREPANNNRLVQKDYIFRFLPPNIITRVVQSKGIVMPIDYLPYPFQLLFTETLDEKGSKQVILKYRNNDREKTLYEGKVLVGSFLDSESAGFGVLEKDGFSIYLGKLDGGIQKVKTYKQVYSVGFIPGKNRLILMNDKVIRCISILP
ncbi:MAG: hypothetical protein ACLFQV_14045 [Vulcanimicrobiota bacterium]